MKIVYIHQHFSTRSGGAGTRSYEFARHLISRGHEVHMICGRNTKAMMGEATKKVEHLDVDGISVHVINVTYRQAFGFWARVYTFLAFAVLAARETVRCGPADLVFATSTPITVAIPGMIGSLFLRVPFVFEVRDIWPESAVATGVLRNRLIIFLTRTFEKFIYAVSDRVVTVSNNMKAELVRENPGLRDKVDVVYIGADLDLFGLGGTGGLREKYGLGNKFLAMFCGAHGTANGLDVLVDAAALLPEDCCIVLIGDGRTKPGLVERAAGIEGEQILFIDPLPKLELAKVLNEVDCGLMILKPLDVFKTVAPNKYFDYLASGLPIIVNFPGEVADKVTERNLGSFVEHNTPEEMAQAIVQLRDNPEERERMRHRSRELAEEYDRTKIAGQFADVMERYNRS